MILARPFSPPLRRLMLAVGAAIAIAGCQGQAQRPPCPQGQVCLEYGNNTEPATLDPQKSNLVDEFAIIGDLIMGLTTDDPHADPAPGMAQSWTTSADGLVWTFKLRDALWSDGEPVTADDFVYAYRRILAPETASIYAYLVFLVKNGEAVSQGKAAPEALGVKALDARTLQITLEHPAPYLPELLKHQSFFPVPRHAVEKWGDAWTQPGKFVGNGPFTLASWRLGDRVTVVKNPRFWDAANVCLDRINFYPTPDLVSAERRVKRGELDINTGFQSNRISRLREPGQMPDHVRTHMALATSYASFNTRDVAAFRDVRVRRALSMAVDRDFIAAKLLRAGQAPAYAFVPPGTANYVKGPGLTWAHLTMEQRQAQARRLLAEAGYGPGNPLSFEIKSASNTDTQLLAQAIQADWKAIGVEARLVQNESQIAFAAYRARDFDVGLMSWFADFNDPVTFLDLFRSNTGAQNYGDYRNPAYDALLDAATQEPDAAKRAGILARAEQRLLDDEALIPMLFVVSRNLVSPRVTGFVDNPANFHRTRWMCLRPARTTASGQ